MYVSTIKLYSTIWLILKLKIIWWSGKNIETIFLNSGSNLSCLRNLKEHTHGEDTFPLTNTFTKCGL